MKKQLYWLLLAVTMVACAPHTQEEEPIVPPESVNEDSVAFVMEKSMSAFPRQHLIEHFTGEGCQYCPYGMASIVEGLQKHGDNFIWVSHHYGYTPDEYTIAESAVIGDFLGVMGAPAMSLNRVSRTIDGQTGYCFHPGYFPEISVPDDDSAQVSVHLLPTYNSATRALSLTVRGTVLTDAQSLNLTVLIKENGLIGRQVDADTWLDWKEFLHTRVARAFLTDTFGIAVEVKDSVYEAQFEYTLPSAWNDEHCVVVAYVTDATNKPIINAAQEPVVSGTTGGEEMNPAGITLVPVPDIYPEEAYSPMTDIVMTDCTLEPDQNLLHVILSNPAQTRLVSGTKCYPQIELVFVTGSTTLAPGTYAISPGGEEGTVLAGTRDDENIRFYGSMYYMLTVSGGNQVARFWLLHTGTVVVGEDGTITIDATTRNSSPVHITYTPAE